MSAEDMRRQLREKIRGQRVLPKTYIPRSETLRGLRYKAVFRKALEEA